MIVSCGIFDPAKSIFKQPKSAKARCETVDCSLEECPLRAKGTCMWTPVLGYTHCPYGKMRVENGPTRRAKSYYTWISDHREKYKGVPLLGSPADMMEFVGDYVYLPYAYMAMNKDVPFLDHSNLFNSGTCLLKKEDWTIDNVLKIVEFLPRAIFNNQVIADYQNKHIPKFLLHLREQDSDIWAQLIKKRPDLDQEPDHIGREAYITTLNAPLDLTTKHRDPKYNVKWHWDGTVLSTSSKYAYHSTWGDIPLDNFTLTATPAEDAVIVVQDNSWVNSETKFKT